MKKVVVGLFLSAFFAVGAFAQDQDPGFNKKQHRGGGYEMAQLNLTDAQKSQLKAIREEYHQKVQSVLTDEQKASMQKMKAAHKGGKKHHRFNAEKMKQELGLTDDQVASLKKNRTEAMEKMKAIRADKSKTEEQRKVELKEFRKQQHESLRSILTEEQLKKLEQKKSHRSKQPVQS